MSRDFRGSRPSSSSSVTTTYRPLRISYPRTISSSSSSRSSRGHTHLRASGVPSGASIRSAAPPPRLAGKSATGMLTSPKLIVPDQNARERPSASSRSGTTSLPAAQARLERGGERHRLAPARRPAELHPSSLRLRLDELEDALAILVSVG